MYVHTYVCKYVRTYMHTYIYTDTYVQYVRTYVIHTYVPLIVINIRMYYVDKGLQCMCM